MPARSTRSPPAACRSRSARRPRPSAFVDGRPQSSTASPSRWGAETTTDDLEGAVAATSDKRPTEAEIRAILPEFTGAIMQVPPRFSAIKIAGERAYDLAREGEVVELEPREIDVHRLELVEMPGRRHTPCSRPNAARAPMSARWPATWAGGSAPAATSWRSAGWPSGRSARRDMISLEKLEELRHKAGLPAALVPRKRCFRLRRRWTTSRRSP